MSQGITYKTKFISLLFFLVASSFCFCQHRTINSGWEYSKDKSTWQTVNIPHTWNKEDAFDDERGYYRGFGYYKKLIYTSSEEKDKIHYLKFNGVNQEATVYVNGNKVGTHKGGYTAFNFEVSPYLNYDTYNLIEVTVDNSHNEDIPPLDADFTFYGGIYRNVEWITKLKQHISLKDFASEGFYVNYEEVSDESASVTVDLIVDNFDLKTVRNHLQLRILDAENNVVVTKDKTIKIGNSSSENVSITFPKIDNPKLWSPDLPYLYKLEIVLSNKEGVTLDTKASNLGFRWVSVDSEKGFFLNGKPIKLIGVNRHQDFKGYGNAVPLHLQKADIQLIKDMGANVIRFAHYPHSKKLYDLCDKLGILVWTETPIINLVTDTEAYFNNCITMQTEHIKQYYNYPSVVMFGYMNEIFIRMVFDRKRTEAEKEHLKKISYQLASQLENLTRELAPNHITVMACHNSEVYNETGIADLPMLLGWNLYFGWYSKQIEDLGTFLDEQHQRFPDRVMFLSEYGPGADVRIFTKTPKKFDFSTNYQTKLHHSYYKQVTERPFMAGMTAWNFADFGSEFRGDPIPHVNQKGLVQYNRKPKSIYYWYQSVLREDPVLHIASDYLQDLILFGSDSFPVEIYSNQAEATVFLNQNEVGKLDFEDGLAIADLNFVHGENTIKVVTNSTTEQKTIHVERIDTLDFETFTRIGINFGSHFYFKDKERGVTFVPDKSYQEGGLYGYIDGEAYGMTANKNQGIPHNIINTTSEPLFQTMLSGCENYKIDVANGSYKISLFFVEPKIPSEENIYNLSDSPSGENASPNKRIFIVKINDTTLENQFNLARAFPTKYGVELSTQININNNHGLSLKFEAIEGEPVVSGILIEKLN